MKNILATTLLLLAFCSQVSAQGVMATRGDGSKPLSTPTPIAIGRSAPNFSAFDENGKVVKLSGFRGKAVLLDFWATWCGPCVDSFTHLQEIKRQSKGKLVVLALCTMDTRDAFRSFVAKNKRKYAFRFVFDPAKNEAKCIGRTKFGNSALPGQVLISPQGKVTAITIGNTIENQRKMVAAINKLGVVVSVAPVPPKSFTTSRDGKVANPHGSNSAPATKGGG